MNRYLFLLLLLTLFASPVYSEMAPVVNGGKVQSGQTDWSIQIPDDSRAKALTDSDKGAARIRFQALSNTDLWAVRNAAPIAWTKTPAGNFAVETVLELDSINFSSVAGLVVGNGSLDNVPRFSFGLDHWGGTQKVKFQGLGTNNPAIDIPCPNVTKIWLRLECYRKGLTNRVTDFYVASFKLQECAPWKEVYRLSETISNEFAGLMLKTATAQGVTFSQFKIEPLADNLYVVEPPKVYNPADVAKLFEGKKVLFVSRPQYRGDHHNTATMFQTGEINTNSFRGGSALKYIDYTDSAKVKTLLDCPEGIIRDPEVSWDGNKILFSMRQNKEDDFHIYEIDFNSKEVRQITNGVGLSDIDPNYLPDGRIVFSSTREPKYCMCNRHIMCNLYTMNADGTDILQIGHSTLHEGHSGILSDGRIIYDRWEYVDRNFGDAQGLWVSNPDGTSHLLYYGNNTGAPGAFLDAREVPGSTLVVCTLGSCHDRPWGAIGLLDRTKGYEGKDGIVKTWPESAIDRVNVNGSYDAMVSLNPKYEDPYPLSATQFLCSRMAPGRGEQTGLVLLDITGSETDIYAETPDSGRGCFDPMLIQARPKARIIEDRIDLSQKTGTFYVADVYIGTGMEAIERGSVKWLRVVESPEKRFWSPLSWMGSGDQAPGMAFNDYNNKRILGTVPVEDDGSANFEIPADTFVYFQLLDEKGQMIQSMRSGTIVRPGENQGCIGCHEDRLAAVAPLRQVKALKRPASKLEPWYGPARTFSFTAEVQPVFDRNCLKCHDYGKPGAKKICLAGDLNIAFNNSYCELRKNQQFVKVIGAGPAAVQNPRTWGSSVSRLAEVVLNGHGDPERDAQLKLSQEDKDRIITWIDINAPYYPEYSTPFPNNAGGRSPLTQAQAQRLTQLTGLSFERNHGSQSNINKVWFTRPELSGCLETVAKDSAEYKEILSIIQSGKAALEATPRPDMPNYQLQECETPVQAKYDRRLEEEKAREAAAAKKTM